MAWVGVCPICKQDTLNCDLHPDCKIAKLEDLLSRVKNNLGEGGFITPELNEEICKGKFDSLENFLKKKEEDRRLQSKELVRQSLRNKALAEAARQFDTANPPLTPVKF